MSQPQRKSWTWAGYLDWEARQDMRYELVDGEVYAMGGGTAAQDLISGNVRMALRLRLRGTGCRPHGTDLKVQTGNGMGRYPDAFVDCGQWDPEALVASNPVLVFEVLSKSSASIDHDPKLRDYASTTCIQYYVILEQTRPLALVHARDLQGRFDPEAAVRVAGLDSAIELPGLGLSLTMAEVYEGLEFDVTADFPRPA